MACLWHKTSTFMINVLLTFCWEVETARYEQILTFLSINVNWVCGTAVYSGTKRYRILKVLPGWRYRRGILSVYEKRGDKKTAFWEWSNNSTFIRINKNNARSGRSVLFVLLSERTRACRAACFTEHRCMLVTWHVHTVNTVIIVFCRESVLSTLSLRLSSRIKFLYFSATVIKLACVTILPSHLLTFLICVCRTKWECFPWQQIPRVPGGVEEWGRGGACGLRLGGL